MFGESLARVPDVFVWPILKTVIIEQLSERSLLTLDIVFSDWSYATRQGCFGYNPDN